MIFLKNKILKSCFINTQVYVTKNKTILNFNKKKRKTIIKYNTYIYLYKKNFENLWTDN